MISHYEVFPRAISLFCDIALWRYHILKLHSEDFMEVHGDTKKLQIIVIQNKFQTIPEAESKF